MRYAIQEDKLTKGFLLEIDSTAIDRYANEGYKIYEFRELHGEQLKYKIRTIKLEDERRMRESRRQDYERLRKEFEI